VDIGAGSLSSIAAPRTRVRKRDVRWIRILAYSAITLAAVAGIVMLFSGEIGGGIIVLVIAILLGLAFARIEQYLKRDAEIV
jgi:hypothetical protein